jgi:plastocyanin domain-containing protein
MASFNINFPGSPGDFVVSANNTIKTKGGIFTGDQKAGTFSLKTLIGAVKGNYQVLPAAGSATEVAITITQKPLLVPLSKIKQVIEGYF